MEKNMNNLERYEVVKAGGWSLANADRVRSVMDYIKGNPGMRYFVPSAPGAINNGDIKVTDRLIACCRLREEGQSFEDDFNAVRTQFSAIAQDLGYYGIDKQLDLVEEGIIKGSNYDWVISRGEAVNGRLWADLLDFRFIDPTELIRFRKDGQLDERSYAQIARGLRGRDRFVIPGFYGLGATGEVHTFPRDGSDVTGSVVARGVNASIYRNLTNIDGVYSADPGIVGKKTARLIEELTYREYRELGSAGFKVLHKDTIVPVASVGIPINVRHSELPGSRGTLVVGSRVNPLGQEVIGIAGRGGFVSLDIHKWGMDDDRGIGRRILQVIEKNGISITHPLTENDSMSIIFSEDQLNTGKEEKIMEALKRQIKPTEVNLRRNIGILSLVGQGISGNGSMVTAKLEEVLNGHGISYGITRLPRSISIRVFLESNRLADAICVSHEALVG